MDKNTFSILVHEFKFKELFNRMGWDRASGSFALEHKDQSYDISILCEKSGFKVLQCCAPSGSPIPSKIERMSLQSKLKRRFYEHLLIFTDDARQKQIWQYSYKPLGKPLKTIITEYNISQDPGLLYQRSSGLIFKIDEEGNITLKDVIKRMADAIDKNSEKVTKKFYDGFKKQHAKFLDYIKGIVGEDEKKWYASVMLNRLMFCYFIQKQGFLDGNIHYLNDKLQECRLIHGRDQFYSFYRNFLLQLFHRQLGGPHDASLTGIFGKIPYLNGGIFSVHEIEKKYPEQIKISDEAFSALFSFFDEYQWHLDTSETASGRDINPDVIGYIFEKYINDRAQMGAYYTKEDITEYIGKNTILPYLFDEVQRHYPEAFKAEEELWQKLKSSEDLYIYKAVKHGVIPEDIWHDLPDDVRVGLDPEQENLVELRRCWNRPAPSEAALPTEIWREVITRRQRYQELRSHIDNSAITSINDFITYNLDIRQFTLDLLNETNNTQLVYQFYKALKNLTILDPTCGSGAFLFAAMNILEDIYEVCLIRMQEFVSESPGRISSHIKKELDAINLDEHPNLEYFIYKSIILNNLYGVDIMPEAVEIAKLRLFLKLVACVDPDPNHSNYGLEPLPDIDFNIRCGNTLVGYANWDEIDNDNDVIADIRKCDVPDMLDMVSKANELFKSIQLNGCKDFRNFVDAKEKLDNRLKELTSHLDSMLHQHYSSLSFEEWKYSHQPFHWVAEFYDTIHKKEGFDIVIGNPPYVETSKVQYSLDRYKTSSCGNLYAMAIERSLQISNTKKTVSMIVQLPIICTDRMIPLQNMLVDKYTCWFSTYDDRPGKLFADLQHIRATILITKAMKYPRTFSTRYNRWVSAAREYLFHSVHYIDANPVKYDGAVAKIGDETILSILKKSLSRESAIHRNVSDYRVYYHNAPQYWIRALDYVPYFNSEREGISISTQVKQLSARSESEKMTLIAIMNSSLFYIWFVTFSDCRHLNLREINTFPYNLEQISEETISRLSALVSELMSSYKMNSKKVVAYYKASGRVEYDEYYPRLSKEIIDNIDIELGAYYEFTPKEVDYIVNFDIKYRVGDFPG